MITRWFALSDISLLTTISASIIATLFGIAVAMMIVSLASNRVEGLAVSKLTGITLMGLIVAGLVSDSWRWFTSILPSFWVGQLIFEKDLWPTLLLGILVCLFWFILFTKRFIKKIS